MAYLPYHEPSISGILSLTSFIVLLNVVRSLLDRLLYCGLIGEVLLGVVWGGPVGGTKWLSSGIQETVQALGYLGLLALVFEGGISTSISQFRSTLLLSVAVATVGLITPIALSFLLLLLPFPNGADTTYPTPLAAFSAGASLCSTSLGTTFAIISAAKLHNTRLGVVLVGAAMMDDVVGLVMVKIVTSLSSRDFTAWRIARPIVASIGLLLVIMAITPWAMRPALGHLIKWLDAQSMPGTAEKSKSRRLLSQLKAAVRKMPHPSFIFSVVIIYTLITVAAFVGASVLFAAFLAGGMVTYLLDDITISETSRAEDRTVSLSVLMYNKYYRPVVDTVLAPFFFASIGFAIPIRDMFVGHIVWKGLVYAVLMAIAKGIVGVVVYADYIFRTWKAFKSRSDIAMRRPHYPALIISLAMIARGEIGFLIASLAASSRTLTVIHPSVIGGPLSGHQDVFLVIIWAVILCTLIGPIGVGVSVRRLRRDSSLDGSLESAKTILGRWG